MNGNQSWLEQLRGQLSSASEGWVLLIGRKMVEGALNRWWDVVGVATEPGCDWQLPQWSGLETTCVAAGLATDAGSSDGVIGLARSPDESADVAGFARTSEDTGVVLVCPAIVDPFAAGLVIRSAYQNRLAGVVFGSEGANPFTVKAMATAGPRFFEVEIRQADNGQILRSLRGAGYTLVGASSESLEPASTAAHGDLTGRVAIIIGTFQKETFWWRAMDHKLDVGTEPSVPRTIAEVVRQLKVIREIKGL